MSSILCMVLVLGFTLLSGFNDGGNLLATFVNTRVMTVAVAVTMILLTLILGPMLFGTAVAHTIGTQIIDVRAVGLATLNIALLGTLATLLLCWRLKVPTSTSFALVGGMIGASIARYGLTHVIWLGVVKVLASMVLAVLCGTVIGFLAYVITVAVLRRSTLRLGIAIGNMQYLTALLVCFGYGTNDAEKSLGLVATIQMMENHHPFQVHTWMILLTTAVFGIGILLGGWRIAKTIGFHVFRARPVHSFATQLASATVVLTASALGGPVSSTQTIDSALIGVGVRAGKERIRWSVVRKMGLVWMTTMPLSFALSCILGLLYDIGGVLH